MWSKKFVYVLNYLKNFKAVPKNKPRIHLQQQNKKIHVDDNYPFQSFCSRKVAETIVVLQLPSFTKKAVSDLKEEKWIASLNSAYLN